MIIAKIGKLIFHSFQHIARPSWKYDHFWAGGMMAGRVIHEKKNYGRYVSRTVSICLQRAILMNTLKIMILYLLLLKMNIESFTATDDLLLSAIVEIKVDSAAGLDAIPTILRKRCGTFWPYPWDSFGKPHLSKVSCLCFTKSPMSVHCIEKETEQMLQIIDQCPSHLTL